MQVFDTGWGWTGPVRPSVLCLLDGFPLVDPCPCRQGRHRLWVFFDCPAVWAEDTILCAWPITKQKDERDEREPIRPWQSSVIIASSQAWRLLLSCPGASERVAIEFVRRGRSSRPPSKRRRAGRWIMMYCHSDLSDVWDVEGKSGMRSRDWSWRRVARGQSSRRLVCLE